LAQSLERFAPGTNERHAAELAIRGLTPAPLPEGIAGTNDALFGGGLTYQRLDDILTRVQGVKGASVVAGLVRAARDAISKQVPAEAQALRGAYRASTLDRLALPALLRAGSGLGGIGEAARQAYHGNYGRAGLTAAAGLVGAGSLGQGIAAAGPLARAALGAGSVSMPLPVTGPSSPSDLPETEDPAAIIAETPPTTTTTSTSSTTTTQPPSGLYGREIAAVSKLTNVPERVLRVFLTQESGGDQQALSGGGWAGTPAHGLMQITPETFKSVAPDVGKLLGRTPSVDNPIDNLIGGGLLLRRYLDRTGNDLGLTAKLYHGGENTALWGPRTEQYSQDILRRFGG
jgi:soluble lytic murein transglycosylase-like protein